MSTVTLSSDPRLNGPPNLLRRPLYSIGSSKEMRISTLKMQDTQVQNKVTKKVRIMKVRNRKRKEMARSRRTRPSLW